jgi:hypothetical protein
LRWPCSSLRSPQCGGHFREICSRYRCNRSRSGAIFGVWMFFGPTWDAVVVGHRIRIVPDRMQGRAESVGSLVAFGSAALGPLAAGLLASRLTGTAAFLCVTAIGTVVALDGVAAWSRGLRSVAAGAPA